VNEAPVAPVLYGDTLSMVYVNQFDFIHQEGEMYKHGCAAFARFLFCGGAATTWLSSV
jgi:hypothetical protein